MAGPGLARELLDALDRGHAVECPSDSGLDLPAAYRVAAEIAELRAARGELRVGRKIGFTNRSQWGGFGIAAPVWGAMYQTTVRPNSGTFALGTLSQPKIEPEIVLRLGACPDPEMDADALIACVSHVGHGFEIVQSPYPGWRLRVPDAVAAAGLHAALLHGPLVEVAPSGRDQWRRALEVVGVSLSCDGAVMDKGSGQIILGSGPLAALAALAGLLAGDPLAPPLEPGEIISTGSLSAAFPVAPGETWTTELSGIPLDGLRLGFERGPGAG